MISTSSVVTTLLVALLVSELCPVFWGVLNVVFVSIPFPLVVLLVVDQTIVMPHPIDFLRGFNLCAL